MPGERRSRFVGRLGAVAWLLAVWLLLWGRVTPVTVLGGLAVAVTLTWGVRLPQVRLALRPRPLLLLVELGRLGVDVVASTAALVRAVVRTGAATRSSIVRLPVRAPDEGLAVVVACWVSLTPGSLVLELDLAAGEVVVHTAPSRDPARVRDEAARLEARLLRALGAPR